MINDWICFDLGYGRKDTKTDIMNISKTYLRVKIDKRINGWIKLLINCKIKKYYYNKIIFLANEICSK